MTEFAPLAPEAILRLDAAEADRYLDELEARVPRRAPWTELPREAATAVVFGDSHGDWRSTQHVAAAFHALGPSAVLVGLGDYIDRAPSDLPAGSVANALFLLGLTAASPDRVFLVQGNHETMRRIPAAPHSFPRELERLWGRSGPRYERLMGLLERGPLVVTSRSGAYFAHAGFPRVPQGVRWQDAVAAPSEGTLLDLVWSEPEASAIRRGAAEPWSEADLAAFLSSSGLGTVWRGHDPDLAGRPIYHDRVMTLHTTRVFQQYGGVLLAVVPLDRPLSSVRAAELRSLHIETPQGGPPAPPRNLSDP